MRKKTRSEFGKGFIYNLVLFAKHWLMMNTYLSTIDGDYSLWFNGASDHFYELEIPKKWKNTEIGKKAQKLKDLALEAGHGSGLLSNVITKKEYLLAFQLLEEIALLIDKKLGVEPIKATNN